MNILVTGAKGFVGRNLCAALANIRDGKDRRERYQSLLPLKVFEYDLGGTDEELNYYCSQADFVFNLAGVNRPKDTEDFMRGNFGFASELLNCLERHGNACPVMLSSSAQASLEGRFSGSEYGKSKLAGEELFREYSERTSAPVLIYRFPNLYGKWCRPRYNSAVATFCDAIANRCEYTVNDPSVELELLYIDDLVGEMLDALLGEEHRCDYRGLEAAPNPDGAFCYVPVTDTVSLGRIVELLQNFRDSRSSLAIPDQAAGSFSKKLHATFLSYYEPDGFAYYLTSHADEWGSFTEVLRTPERGQVSVNVSKPGITKGNHWHNTKWEKFLVVSGEASIKLRKVGTDADGNPFPVTEYVVSGEKLQVVEMIPGYTHNITNLSETDDLVTLMWASESFDPANPDTFAEEV